jgi:hypothetical protein
VWAAPLVASVFLDSCWSSSVQSDWARKQASTHALPSVCQQKVFPALAFLNARGRFCGRQTAAAAVAGSCGVGRPVHKCHPESQPRGLSLVFHSLFLSHGPRLSRARAVDRCRVWPRWDQAASAAQRVCFHLPVWTHRTVCVSTLCTLEGCQQICMHSQRQGHPKSHPNS